MAALLLLAFVLPACASLPDKGPVEQGLPLEVERDESAVRPIGQPPVPGATPREIVLGFLRAGADFEGNHQVARQYLAPSIRQRWRASTGTVLYNRAEGDLSLVDRDGTVVVSAPEVARIKSDGHYVAAAAGARIERTFELTKVSGQWRISELDDGLLLGRTAVEEVYRQLNLYFPARSGKVLVPDPVFLPALPGLSTKLVTRLLRGPTTALRGAVTTGFPQGTSLAITSVPIRDGVAFVRLDAAAAQADETAEEVMSAQLVWTLKQLPEFRALRVEVDGEPLAVTGVPNPQPRDAWTKPYHPDALRDDATAYAIRDGRVGLLLDGKKFVPIAGPAGDGALASRSVGVSLDLTRFAVVTPDGRSLLIGRLRPPSTPTRRLAGSDFSPPSWDALGNLWIADRRNGRLWLVPPGDAEPVPVAFDDDDDDSAPRGKISAVRVARDGARVAFVAGAGAESRLYVGAVLRDEEEGAAVQVAALREVQPELRHVSDVAWLDATKLAVVGRLDEDIDVPVITDISGYRTTSIELEPGLVTIAAAPPPHSIVAGTQAGRLQRYTATGEWEPVAEGTAPAYPG